MSSRKDHGEIGALAQSLGIDHLVCVDEPDYGRGLSSVRAEMVVHYFKDKADALSIADHFSPGDVVLVKASRAERMEELAEELMTQWELRGSVEQ